MCKEDIRISRKKAPRPPSVGSVPSSGTPVRLCTANPNRVAAVVATAATFTFADRGVQITAGQDTTAVVAVLTQTGRSALLRIEDLGQLVTGELWAWSITLDDGTVTVQEVEFLEPLEDV